MDLRQTQSGVEYSSVGYIEVTGQQRFTSCRLVIGTCYRYQVVWGQSEALARLFDLFGPRLPVAPSRVKDDQVSYPSSFVTAPPFKLTSVCQRTIYGAIRSSGLQVCERSESHQRRHGRMDHIRAEIWVSAYPCALQWSFILSIFTGNPTSFERR